MSNDPNVQERHNDRPGIDVAVLVTALVGLAAYPLLRYGGYSGDGDAAAFARLIQSVYEANQIVPSGPTSYGNGYGYQTLALFAMELSGVTLSQFQLYVSLFLMPWIVLPAWLLYRELTGSSRGATLATVILLVQPEFLFPLLRGTHEKFTRGLILLALYFFVKSIGHHHMLSRMAGYVLGFYLVVYGIIAFNAFMSFSLLAALLLTLMLLAMMRWWRRTENTVGSVTERRLAYAVVVATVIAFVFVFYVYTPAQHNLLVLRNLFDQASALLLDVERTSTQAPYAYTAGAWVSGPIYLVMSLANWLLLAVSAVIWLRQSALMVRRRALGKQAAEILLWALYGAFAVQGMTSVGLDLVGALGSNLQVRAFASFAMLAAPLVARLVTQQLDEGTRQRPWAWGAVAATLGLVAVLSVLKATNEPLVSNKWGFYSPAEMEAIDRAEAMLPQRSLWLDFDERLEVARRLRDPVAPFGVRPDAWDRDFTTRDILVSDVIRARGIRLSATPPVEADSMVTYDNGQVQIYHLRPRTPFQR